MQFDLIGIITDPFVLMFIAVATGILFGKIKFGKFNFGTSGTLFTGLLIGWGVYTFGTSILEKSPEEPGFEAVSKMLEEGIIHSYFFNASLIFFVAAVGLLAAKDMGTVLRKYGKTFIIIGFLVTLVGAGATYAATAVIPKSDPYEIAGVYTGALTSSPGLGAAIETAEGHATEYANNYESLSPNDKALVIDIIDDPSVTLKNTATLSQEQKDTYISNAVAGVGIGHAIGYPFGVIIVIFAVNFFDRIFKMDINKEKQRFAEEMAQAKALSGKKDDLPNTAFSIAAFSVTCFVGYLVGSIEIYLGPLGYFSLGATGGTLIMGLVLGYIGKIGGMSFRMDPKALAMVRELSLAFFLAIVGLKYGYRTFEALFGSGIYLALTSLFVGIIAMSVAFILGRYVFKLNWIMLCGAICGGMTSTPGLGAAIDALESDDPAAGYGATYPFALLGMIIFTIVLHKLPLL